MKQALTCCGALVPTLNQTGRVEAEALVQQHPGQLVLEDLGVALGGEVAVLAAGRAVGEHDPVDELTQAALALRAADRAAEVLRGDDVGGVDAPLGGELHAALLEVDRAVAPVGHDDVAALPGHLVVGVHTGGGEDALDLQALAPARRLGAAAGAGPAKRSSVSVMVWSSPWSSCAVWAGRVWSARCVLRGGSDSAGEEPRSVRGLTGVVSGGTDSSQEPAALPAGVPVERRGRRRRTAAPAARRSPSRSPPRDVKDR